MDIDTLVVVNDSISTSLFCNATDTDGRLAVWTLIHGFTMDGASKMSI